MIFQNAISLNFYALIFTLPSLGKGYLSILYSSIKIMDFVQF